MLGTALNTAVLDVDCVEAERRITVIVVGYVEGRCQFDTVKAIFCNSGRFVVLYEEKETMGDGYMLK